MTDGYSELVGISYGAGASGLTLLIIAITGVIIIAGWVLFAGSRFLQGGNVERPERVPQLYGYTVCLVCVLVAFASAVTLVDDLIALASPAHPRGEMAAWAEPSVTSFEAFRVSYDRVRQMNVGPGVAPEPIPEDELRRRYEGMRADRIERTRVAAYRSLTRSAFTLLVAALLFLIHWRWLSRRVEVMLSRPEDSPEDSRASG
jgi:hypothetical protein